jgi:hypothetical protein
MAIYEDFYTQEFIDEHKATIRNNLSERYKLLSNAKNDKKAQAVLLEKCKRNPKFFFNYFLYTDRNSLF